MRKRAMLGALLLIGIGVGFGATVFRSNIARATGTRAQRPAVANTGGRPVKSNVKTANSRVLVLEYLNGADDEHFEPIKANLITVQGDTFGSEVWEYLYSDGQLVMFFELQPSERVVMPLAKAVRIDEVLLQNCFGSTQCFSQVNLVGS